jgi:ketosteroid isomerase-like protein
MKLRNGILCPVILVSAFFFQDVTTARAADEPMMTVAKLNALLERQAQAWEKQDFSIAAGDWTADGVLTSPGGHVKVGDLQAVITDYAKHFTKLDVKVTNVFLSPDGKQAAIEWDWDVTRVRDGKQGLTHDAILVTFEGEKIKSWREYFDLGDSVDAQP